MRVLMLTPDFPPGKGGIQQLMGKIAAHLDVRALYVFTFAARDAAESSAVQARDLPHSVRVKRLPAFARLGQHLRVVAFNVAAVAYGLAKSRRVDAILVGHIVAAPAARILTLLTGTPHVTILHAQEIVNRPGLTRRAVAWSSATIAVSTHTRDEAVRAGAPAAKLNVVNPGVDQPARVTPPAEPDAPRRPTIVTVARMVDRYKGHDVMIEAVARVREQIPDVLWIAVGDGPLRASLESQAAERGVGGNVRFAGRVDDAERDRLLAAADVFAMPSRVPPEGGGEGFGLVFLEAQAAGLPVVAGAEGGALDAVIDGATGLLIDPHDPGAVAGALFELLSDDRRRAAMSQAARRHAAARDWATFADGVLDLLVACAARGDFTAAARLRDGGSEPVVLAVSHTAAYGGAERSLVTQLARDARAGEFRAVLASPDGPLAGQAARLGVKVVAGPAFERSFATAPWRLPGAFLELLAAGRRLASVARELDADLIHANSPRAGLIGCSARLFGAPPLVTHVRDVFPQSSVARVTRSAVKAGSAAVIANSRHTARSFDPAVSRVVYNPIDGAFAESPDSWDVATFATRHAIEPSRPLLAIVGQITPWKGQSLAIETLAAVRQTEPATCLAIAGSVKFNDGTRFDNLAYADGLRRQAAHKGVEGAVIYTGELSDVRALLALADVVLMPSWEEPFGRAAAEAMAAGRAVVATSVGGPSEFIEHGVNGMLADPHDVDAWAGLVTELIADPELRRAIGRRARADVMRRFVVESAETSMLGVYAGVSAGFAEVVAA